MTERSYIPHRIQVAEDQDRLLASPISSLWAPELRHDTRPRTRVAEDSDLSLKPTELPREEISQAVNTGFRVRRRLDFDRLSEAAQQSWEVGLAIAKQRPQSQFAPSASSRWLDQSIESLATVRQEAV